MSEKKSIWEKMKRGFILIYEWVLKLPLAFVVAFLIVLGASFIFLSGKGERFNVGGLLGKILGISKREGKKKVRVLEANSIPEKRLDPEGNPLPLGQSDSKGYVQREVKVLEYSKNPFRDKKVIQILKEGGREHIELPTGVLDVDVDKVIEIKPSVYEVIVKKAPQKIDLDEVDKYLG